MLAETDRGVKWDCSPVIKFVQCGCVLLRDATIRVGIAQLVRASDCGSEGRGFKSHYSPQILDYSANNTAQSGAESSPTKFVLISENPRVAIFHEVGQS